MTKTTRICPGEYTVGHGEYVVSISRMDFYDYKYGQWIARANWDQFLVTDPIIYLSDAKREAKKMVDEAIMDDLTRLTKSNELRMRLLQEGTQCQTST